MRITATAVLVLVMITAGCVGPGGEAGSQARPRDNSRATNGMVPADERSANTRLPGLVLPPYLGGYRSISPPGTGQAWVRPRQRDLLCGLHGQEQPGSPAFRDSKLTSAAYADDGRPVLWTAVFSGARVGRIWGKRGIRDGGCGDVEYVIHAGGLKIVASQVRIHGEGDARLLRARVSGNVTLVVACTTVAQGSCAAAMAELVHFLGV